MSINTAEARKALGDIIRLCLTGISVDPVGPAQELREFIDNVGRPTSDDFILVPASLLAALTDHFDPNERIVADRMNAIKMGAALLGKEVGTYEADDEPEPFKAKSSIPFTSADGRVDRVYLSGPMTGIEDFNFPAFNEMAAKLRELGLHVENPADHGVVDGAEWGDYLRHDLARMGTCETIALLPGWSKSKGARLELQVAQALGMKVRVLDGAEEVPGVGLPVMETPPNVSLGNLPYGLCWSRAPEWANYLVSSVDDKSYYWVAGTQVGSRFAFASGTPIDVDRFAWWAESWKLINSRPEL